MAGHGVHQQVHQHTVSPGLLESAGCSNLLPGQLASHESSSELALNTPYYRARAHRDPAREVGYRSPPAAILLRVREKGKNPACGGVQHTARPLQERGRLRDQSGRLALRMTRDTLPECTGEDSTRRVFCGAFSCRPRAASRHRGCRWWMVWT